MAMLLLMGVFLFGSGYCPQYWLWIVPLLVVAWVQQGKTYRIALAPFAAIVLLATVLTFGYDRYLGSFIVKAFGSAMNQQLEGMFSDTMHTLILISLPMTAASLIFWFYNCAVIVKSEGE